MDISSENTQHNFLLIICCIIIFCGLLFLLVGPGIGFPVGTCGSDDIAMTITSDIEPSYAASLLKEFGEPEPGPAPGRLPVMQYPLQKEILDSFMDQEQIAVSEDSIIGLYEFPDSRLLLIDQGSGVEEIIRTDEGTRTLTLPKEPVGSLQIGANETGTAQHGTFLSSTKYNISIQRIDLVLPGPGNETAPLYIVKKSGTESLLNPDETPLATISATGTFYVLFGDRVERVVSSSYVITDPSWTLCFERSEISGEGTAMGELKYTTKFARGSERILRVHLITTGAHVQVHDTTMQTSTSQWTSRDSTGCSC
jgi:hypothetical protein